jgi:two-component system sensor histidine kinase PhoQ
MRSIKSRVMLTTLLALVGFMALTAVALERAVQKRMLQAEEDKLLAQMYSVLAAVDRDATGLSITVSDARLFESALFNPDSELRALIYDQTREIWRSLSTLQEFPRPVDLEAEELRFSEQVHDGKPWFQMAFSIHWPNVHAKLSLYSVVLWKDASDYYEQFKRFRQTLWLWFVVTIVLLMLVTWVLMLWNLRPLRRIGEEVSAIEDGRKQRFDSNYPAEIKPLTQNLNLLLQREQHQMQRYRNALDDLAHSLKTPLAVLRGISEKSGLDAEDQVTLRQQSKRMDQIVSYQLQKAATMGGELLARPVDLEALLNKTIIALRKVYPGVEINTDISTRQALTVRIDESDLLEILGNLIDNACKYGDGRVLVGARAIEQQVALTIEDNGRGLDSSQFEAIIQRGKRLDQNREGQGIGLAVVSEIINAYELDMQMSASAAMRGLKITIRFNLA